MSTLSPIIKQIIYELYPEDVELIGHSNINDIVYESVNFDREDTGHHMDLMEIISHLAAVTTLIQVSWQAYTKLQKHNNKTPSEKEIDSEIDSDIKEIVTIEERIEIYKKITVIKNIVDVESKKNN